MLALSQKVGAPHTLKDLGTTSIDPAATNQIWDVQPNAKPERATVTYSVTNHVDSVSLLSQSSNFKRLFRLINVPVGKTNDGSVANPPDPSPTSPSQFLIFNVGTSSFLGLQHSPRRGSNDNDMRGPEITMIDFSPNQDGRFSRRDNSQISASIPAEDDPLLDLLYINIDEFREQYGWLVWKALPEAWGPADGKLNTFNFTDVS